MIKKVGHVGREGEVMGEMPGGTRQEGKFHATDGWYFERLTDGRVHIVVQPKLDEAPVTDIIFDEGTWCSIVASVSPSGDNAASFAAATAVHQGKAYDPLPPSHEPAPVTDAEWVLRTLQKWADSRLGDLEESPQRAGRIVLAERARDKERIAELTPILQALLDVAGESGGIAGWHLNGAVAGWDEFEFVEQARALLGEVPDAE
jgi:hypothetical protein